MGSIFRVTMYENTNYRHGERPSGAMLQVRFPRSGNKSRGSFAPTTPPGLLAVSRFRPKHIAIISCQQREKRKENIHETHSLTTMKTSRLSTRLSIRIRRVAVVSSRRGIYIETRDPTDTRKTDTDVTSTKQGLKQSQKVGPGPRDRAITARETWKNYGNE